jgi:hypothetical protein
LLPFSFETFGNAGGIAMRMTNAQVFASGSLFTGTSGGNGGLSGFGQCFSGGDGGDAIDGSGSTSVLQTLDDALAAGVGGTAIAPCLGGANGVLIDLPTGTLIAHAGLTRALSTTSPVREGQVLKIQSTGEVGDFAVLLVASAASYADLPGVLGPLLIGPQFSAFPQGIIAGSSGPGTLANTVVIQDLGSGVEGVLLRFQSAFVRASGEIYLSNESDTVLLDAAF